MVRRTGIRVKFDKSLFLAGAVALVFGPNWVMNQFPVAWFVALSITVVACGTIILGVLIHEAGHALAARIAGVKVGDITVSWWGGATSLGPSTFGASLLIALCGPAINGVYAAALLLLSQLIVSPDSLAMGLYLGAWVNAFLTVFNLLPFSPLDGSHALSDLISLITKSRAKGERFVAWFGISMIPVVLVWFIVQGRLSNYWDIILLVLIVGMVWKFSFDKLKKVDLSTKPVFIAKRLCNPVEFAEMGTASKFVSGLKDVVVLQEGRAVGFVPADLANTCKVASPELTVEQLSSRIASKEIPADISLLDLNEYAQGHYLTQSLGELGEDADPTWLVVENGSIIGLIHHRQHLAQITA